MFFWPEPRYRCPRHGLQPASTAFAVLWPLTPGDGLATACCDPVSALMLRWLTERDGQIVRWGEQ